MIHRFFTKRLSIIFFLIQINASRSSGLTPFIAKKVEGIFGYDILLYGFLFRRQWESFSQSFARIGLLFIKWRRVEHKAARARGLSRFGSRAQFHALRCIQASIYTRKTQKICNYVSHSFRYIYNTSLHNNM